MYDELGVEVVFSRLRKLEQCLQIYSPVSSGVITYKLMAVLHFPL